MTNDNKNQSKESQEPNKVKEFLTPTFNVKDKYKEIQKQQGKKPIKRWLKLVTLLLIISTIILLFVSSYTTKKVNELEDSRNVQLDVYEATKFAVLEDIKTYLTIKTKEDYIEAKSRVNVVDWYRDQIFGKSFDISAFYGASNVHAVDVQYSLEDEKGVTKYYLMLNVTKGSETKQIEMLVSVHNNQIYNILVI